MGRGQAGEGKGKGMTEKSWGEGRVGKGEGGWEGGREGVEEA